MKKTIFLIVAVFLLSACGEGGNAIKTQADKMKILTKIYSMLPDGCSIPTTDCMDDNNTKKVMGPNYQTCDFQLKEKPVLGTDKKNMAYVCTYYSSGFHTNGSTSDLKTVIAITNDPIYKQSYMPNNSDLYTNKNIILVDIQLMDSQYSMLLSGASYIYDAKNDIVKKL